MYPIESRFGHAAGALAAKPQIRQARDFTGYPLRRNVRLTERHAAQGGIFADIKSVVDRKLIPGDVRYRSL
jgi:hypothetical protein